MAWLLVHTPSVHEYGRLAVQLFFLQPGKGVVSAKIVLIVLLATEEGPAQTPSQSTLGVLGEATGGNASLVHRHPPTLT